MLIITCSLHFCSCRTPQESHPLIWMTRWSRSLISCELCICHDDECRVVCAAESFYGPTRSSAAEEALARILETAASTLDTFLFNKQILAIPIKKTNSCHPTGTHAGRRVPREWAHIFCTDHLLQVLQIVKAHMERNQPSREPAVFSFSFFFGPHQAPPVLSCCKTGRV